MFTTKVSPMVRKCQAYNQKIMIMKPKSEEKFEFAKEWAWEMMKEYPQFASEWQWIINWAKVGLDQINNAPKKVPDDSELKLNMEEIKEKELDLFGSKVRTEEINAEDESEYEFI